MKEKEIERLNVLKEFENKLYSEGLKYIAGIDEAGRGPLAGPVVAGAVILPKDCRILYINDSKKLSAKKREKLFDIIKEEAVSVGIGMASPERIDEINILQATYEAMRQAIWKKPACHNFSDERRDEEAGQKKEHRAMYGIGG